MEDKRRSERRLEERRSKTIVFFFKSPESILIFPVISFTCDYILKLFSNLICNHFGRHGIFVQMPTHVVYNNEIHFNTTQKLHELDL